MRTTCEAALKAFFHPLFKPTRKALGWTQAKMAETLMMDVRSYSELEHGKSGCSALTLALFLIQVCSDPVVLLKELAAALLHSTDDAA